MYWLPNFITGQLPPQTQIANMTHMRKGPLMVFVFLRGADGLLSDMDVPDERGRDGREVLAKMPVGI
jgi:hypothetical protein